MRLNAFDKVCAVLGMVLAAVLGLLGVIGIFVGCSANFTLPPILGVLPGFVAWGIIKCTLVAWKASAPTLPQQGTWIQ